jgi:transcriptional regulator with XRE-family HTH domain
MENSEIKDRILKLLTTENISSARFADLIGVQRSNISHILSGRNNPGLDFLQKVLARFPMLNSEWLIIGKGEMYKQSGQTEIHFDTKGETNPFSHTVYKEAPPVLPQPPAINPIQKPRSIKQVMVLYDDNSYEILNPENKDFAQKDL